MTDHRIKLVVITGPTASGKSSLAIDLAVQLEGEIVNADSMQVYRGMDIGTAKTPLIERRGIPHHLIDVVDPDEDFNAAIYRSMTDPVLREIEARERVCFVVGGTGLYIKVLLGGLLESPPMDQKMRDELRNECEQRGSIFLHGKLKMLDPESARRIHPHDKVRITRALEIINLSNEPLSNLKRKHGFKNRSYEALKICLEMDREKLYHRINQRCVDMIQDGLVDETRDLLRRGYSSELKPMQSIGYKHMVKVLQGAWGMDQAIHQLQKDTRRYAKRQMTWFRADPEMVCFRSEDRGLIIEKIEEFIWRS